MAVVAQDLPLVRSRTLGRFRVHALEAGLQRLDGGAMFGVVPKVLWEKRIAPDERNRIPLALRCLLVETPDTLVLIDTGWGTRSRRSSATSTGSRTKGRRRGWRRRSGRRATLPRT